MKILENIINLWQCLYKNIDNIPIIVNTKSTIISQARVKQMVQFIELNYHKKISLNDIALNSNISKSEALRCFKSNLKISPIKYLIQFRLNKAKNMLENKHISISQVSSHCGFESTSYFDRMFKRYYGVSPKEYKK